MFFCFATRPPPKIRALCPSYIFFVAQDYLRERGGVTRKARYAPEDTPRYEAYLY